MNIGTNSVSYPSISRWEEAGASIFSALTEYTELSLSLEIGALVEGAPPKYLASRIDSALESLEVVLNQQIFRARSVLSSIRNKLSSPIYRLPSEVLSQIFISTVFASPDPPGVKQVPACITGIFLALRHLVGVCKEWRDIAMAQGEFWSVIPLTHYPSREGESKWKLQNYALSSSMERYTGDLLLAATHPCNPLCDGVFIMLAPRFRAVNIATDSLFLVREIMYMFLNHSSLESLALSQLSIYQDQDDSYYDKLPPEGSYIFPLKSPEQASFEKLTTKLSLLRIRGTQLHWGRVNFSQTLTELHLQEVFFGYDSALIDFVRALSSASLLQSLKLISIRSCFEGSFPYETPTGPKIQLPNLRNLLVDDLYFNTLDHFLSSVTSDSHRLTLLLTWRCRYIQLVGNSKRRKLNRRALHGFFKKVVIDDLLLAGDIDDPWLSSSKLGDLMKHIPPGGLKTLWINSWDLDAPFFNTFASHLLPRDSTSSCVIDLHITCARIRDHDASLNMLAEHSEPIRRIILGVAVKIAASGSEGDADAETESQLEWAPLSKDSPLALAIKNSVPDAQFVGNDTTPPEFKDAPWRVW